MSKETALKMIKLALTSNDVKDAYAALGYCKCIFETDENEGNAVTKLDVTVESEAPIQEEHKPTFQEFCEAETQRLKHDVIAEEEKTLYLHRAYLKDEVCKRWPKTNVMIKKILHGHGLVNIEDYYNYFTNPDNWFGCTDWGISIDDRDKMHNLYLTLNEESGELAEVKLQSYINGITGKDNARVTNALARELNIRTKSQLRYVVKEKGYIPYIRGVSNENIDLINDRVNEELALHMV